MYQEQAALALSVMSTQTADRPVTNGERPRERQDDQAQSALGDPPSSSRLWKSLVRSEIVDITAELDRLAATARRTNGDATKPFEQEARAQLLEAHRILMKGGLRQALMPGADIDASLKSVHAAASLLPHLTSCPELHAQATELAEKARRTLPAGQRRETIEKLASPAVSGVPCHFAFANARKSLYEITDRRYTRLRRFRNNLIIAGALVGVVVALLVIIGWRAPHSLPLCFQSETETSVVRACPTSEHRESDAPASSGSIISGSTTPDGTPGDDDVFAVASSAWPGAPCPARLPRNGSSRRRRRSTTCRCGPSSSSFRRVR